MESIRCDDDIESASPGSPGGSACDGHPSARTIALRAALLMLLFVIGLALLIRFDLTLVRWLGRPPNRGTVEEIGIGGSLLRGLRSFAEPFALWSVVIAIAAFDRRRKRVLGHLVLALCIAWACQAVGKASVSRTRPGAYDGVKWSGMWQGVGWGSRPQELKAFPSGHTTMAFAFGLTLARLYPSLRWLFLALAVGCGASRVLISVHWPSDCWAGAWLGATSSWIALRAQNLLSNPERAD